MDQSSLFFYFFLKGGAKYTETLFHWIRTILGTLSSYSLWSSSCMRHNGCRHSLLIPLQLAYFWLFFCYSFILIWTTCLALKLIKQSTTLLALCLQRALAHTIQLYLPPVCIQICIILVPVSTLPHLIKVSDLIFCPLILLFFFLSPPAQMNNKWGIMGIALSDEQLCFVSQMP